MRLLILSSSKLRLYSRDNGRLGVLKPVLLPHVPGSHGNILRYLVKVPLL